jgi:hypothetical protein
MIVLFNIEGKANTQIRKNTHSLPKYIKVILLDYCLFLKRESKFIIVWLQVSLRKEKVNDRKKDSICLFLTAENVYYYFFNLF